MSKTEVNLSGKDWLTVDEAAHYCGVSNRQFREHAIAYGLQPKRFMGKQLYEKAALYAAISAAPLWFGCALRGGSRQVVTHLVGQYANLSAERRKPFRPRKKPQL
jgi:hypothetical protein